MDEIPDSHIDRPADSVPYDSGYERIVDEDYLEYRRREQSYHSPDGYSYGTGSRGSQTAGRPARSGPSASKPSPQPSPKPKLLEVSVGDRVRHKAFGEGVIRAYTSMPGDALITVDFDSSGEKRLMLRTAGAFMEKL